MLDAIFGINIIFEISYRLGHYLLIIPTTLAIVFIFFGMHRTIRCAAIYYSITVVSLLLKILIAAPRPGDSFHQDGRSFPSGHTMIITVLALFMIMYVIKNRHQLRVWLSIAIVSTAVSLAFLGSFVRVHIGVHTVWEVLGTYAIITAVFLLFSFIFDYIVKRWVGNWRIWKFFCRYEGVPKWLKNRSAKNESNETIED